MLKSCLTQKQRAEKAGVKQNIISDYEKRPSQPTKKMASKFAEIMKVKAASFQ
jgi:ribosome-binding protein aMBF1 (putative translation factor)